MISVHASRKDIASGLVFIAVGLLYGGVTLRDLPIGQAFNMGPGYFPLLLCGLLIAIGAGVVARGLFHGDSTPFGVIPWRGMVLLVAAICFFAATIEGLGLFFTVFITATLAGLASGYIKPWAALAAALCLAVACTIVFAYGIRLPVSPIGYWFQG